MTDDATFDLGMLERPTREAADPWADTRVFGNLDSESDNLRVSVEHYNEVEGIYEFEGYLGMDCTTQQIINRWPKPGKFRLKLIDGAGDEQDDAKFMQISPTNSLLLKVQQGGPTGSSGGPGGFGYGGMSNWERERLERLEQEAKEKEARIAAREDALKAKEAEMSKTIMQQIMDGFQKQLEGKDREKDSLFSTMEKINDMRRDTEVSNVKFLMEAQQASSKGMESTFAAMMAMQEQRAREERERAERQREEDRRRYEQDRARELELAEKKAELERERRREEARERQEYYERQRRMEAELQAERTAMMERMLVEAKSGKDPLATLGTVVTAGAAILKQFGMEPKDLVAGFGGQHWALTLAEKGIEAVGKLAEAARDAGYDQDPDEQTVVVMLPNGEMREMNKAQLQQMAAQAKQLTGPTQTPVAVATASPPQQAPNQFVQLGPQDNSAVPPTPGPAPTPPVDETEEELSVSDVNAIILSLYEKLQQAGDDDTRIKEIVAEATKQNPGLLTHFMTHKVKPSLRKAGVPEEDIPTICNKMVEIQPLVQHFLGE